MNECILDEITHTIKVLTDRPGLKISGSYNEDQNRIISVQINAGKTPIPDDDLVAIQDLYDLRFYKTFDSRKKGYREIGKAIRYLMSSTKQMGLVL